MNFSTNYDNLNDLIPKGSYECIVKSAAPSATKKGKAYLDVRLVIRNDVDQKYKDRYIFHKIWEKNDPNEADRQVDNYDFSSLMKLAQAVGLPSGKNYASIDAICNDFVGKCVKVEIYHDEYNGNVSEKVRNFKITDFPDCKHAFKASAAPAANTAAAPKRDAFAQPPSAQQPAIDLSDFEEIADGDLPF